MKNNRLYLLFFVALFTVNVQADPSAPLIRINGKTVPLSDFLYFAYRQQATPDRETFNRFVDFKLNVEYARDIRVDTTRHFAVEQELWLDKILSEQLFNNEKSSELSYNHPVYRVIQFLYPVPQRYDNHREEQTAALLDRFHLRLAKELSADLLPEEPSVKVDTFYYNGYNNYYIEEITDALGSLRVGEISKPFRTALGWHILVKQEMDHAAIPVFRERKNIDDVIARLKEKHHFREKSSFRERQARENTALFSIEDREYRVEEFEKFAVNRKGGARKLYGEFIHKALLDYEKESLLLRDAAFKQRYVYGVETSLYQLVDHRNNQLWNWVDDETLSRYYEANRKQYGEGEVVFHGAVIHTVTKSLYRHVKKRMKKIPQSDWKMRIEEEFNRDGLTLVEIEQGDFRMGDNPFVDNRIYKVTDVVPTGNLSHTQVSGKKIKREKVLLEQVYEQVKRDYRNSRKWEWNHLLVDKFGLEIDEEVLKTVNNL